jgi:alkylation response protein AidB-like acyl-CoA dehydrogenase
VRLHYDEPTEEFRRELRAWMTENLPSSSERAERVRSSAHIPAWARAWQRKLFDNGWLVPGWPPEYGGRNATPVQQMVYFEELALLGVPRSCNPQGLSIITPSILDWGTDEQKERYALPTLRAEISWCLGMSEPNAGSDLAGLRTRAELHGDRFVVNGQKVWTSGAHHSDWGLLLARTDLDAPKHKGITAFLLDMHTPGIEVRPLRQINGMAHFNEVFLTDVVVPDSCRLGTVNEGWRVANTMLSNERAMIGGGGRVGWRDIVGLAQHLGATHDPQLRQQLAQSFTRLQLIKWLGWRARSRKDQGLGPEASVLKLAASRRQELDGNLVLALQGAAGMLYDRDAVANGYWQQQFLMQWSSRIGGGTEQIQRNVIGERVLGLPGEPRVDKDVAFRELAGS